MAEKLIDSWLGWFPDIEGDRECKVIEENGRVEFAVLDREDGEWIYDGDANPLLLNRFKENKTTIQALQSRVEELEKGLDQAINRGNIEFAFIAGTRRQVLTAEANGNWAPSRTPELAKYLKEQQR